MSRHARSLDADYFEDMFQGDEDPWSLETSAYEAAKFDRSVAALSGRSYDSAFEIGCAGGSLTERLAPLCSELLAIDISETAVVRARRRCVDLPQVEVERMAFPSQTPRMRAFDLIVLSEVAYYWDDTDLRYAATFVHDQLTSGGDLLLVHYTGETDYPQSGDEAVEKLAVSLSSAMDTLQAGVNDHYRLDLWRRR